MYYHDSPSRKHQKLVDEESDSKSSFDSEFLQFLQIVKRQIQLDQTKCLTQHQVVIENTPVFFPHPPYDVQEEYMKNAIQALDKKQNALLESPTGTGKTLSLLCASLAWLKKYRQNLGGQRQLKIIYSSRTHAQLKQVAKELKKTVYQPNVAMLGSRDQYCIRGDLSHLKGNTLNQICQKSKKQNNCMFYEKEKISSIAQQYPQLLNSLEEARLFGQQNKCCPYYFERERALQADIILMPYNYLLDKNFLHLVQIKDSIIIFDEAHNVQSAAQDGSSFSISQNNVIEAENELGRWIEMLEDKYVQTKTVFVPLIINLNSYKQIQKTIQRFKVYLIEQSKSKLEEFSSTGKYEIRQGRDIFEIVESNTKTKGSEFKNGLNQGNMKSYLQLCQEIFKTMDEHSSIEGNNFKLWMKFLENIYDLLAVDQERYLENKDVYSLENHVNQFRVAFQFDQSNELHLHMWCLDPSLAFKRLINSDIYSIILTSGTLAPFESWACELRVEFPIYLQNKHIIDIASNLRVFQNKSLDFSFAKRKDEEQVNQLGNSLLNFCKVIPNGILVIFSSYSLMNELRKKWTHSKILLRIQEIKACLWEPNQTAEMQNVFEMYKQKANKGAIMFAVQRGKVAEGIDFSDELCRAVFLIGVPYPPKTDQKLNEKMAYLDQLYNAPEFAHEKRLKSQEWYTQQAIRATNQALGRVIRHVNDYGIVFLCDKRFQYGDIFRGLSEWVKPAINSWFQDNGIFDTVSKFFKINRSINVVKQQMISQQGTQQNDVIQRDHQAQSEIKQKLYEQTKPQTKSKLQLKIRKCATKQNLAQQKSEISPIEKSPTINNHKPFQMPPLNFE